MFEDPPRELRFVIDDRNIVSWKTLPVGEAGSTIPFPSEKGAEEFVISYAIRMGYVRKLIEDSQDLA